MKKMIIGGIAAAALAAGVATASTANATPAPIGYSHRGVIAELAGPATPYNTEEAVAMVDGAEFHFCPEYF
jgi:hypothetical protein